MNYCRLNPCTSVSRNFVTIILFDAGYERYANLSIVPAAPVAIEARDVSREDADREQKEITEPIVA